MRKKIENKIKKQIFFGKTHLKKVFKIQLGKQVLDIILEVEKQKSTQFSRHVKSVKTHFLPTRLKHGFGKHTLNVLRLA